MKPERAQNTRTRKTWLIYALLSLYVFMLNVPGPVTNYLKDEFGMSYTLSSAHFRLSRQGCWSLVYSARISFPFSALEGDGIRRVGFGRWGDDYGFWPIASGYDFRHFSDGLHRHADSVHLSGYSG